MEINSKQATHIFIKHGNEVLVTITDGGIVTTDGLSVQIVRPEREYSTIEEIAAIEGEILIPRQVATILKCHPYSINCQAQSDPTKLGFPVMNIRNRIKIPKNPLLDLLTKGKIST